MCNINAAEVAYRKKAMWFGVVTSLVLFVILLLLGVTWWLSVPLLFIPVYIGAIGYLQVRYRFCVSYGASGQQHADDNGVVQTVTDSTAQSADKAKVRRMNLQAFGMTLFVLMLCSLILAL
jgi:hypothetical protein